MNRSTPLQICLALATVATVSCGGPKGSEGSEIAAISTSTKKSAPSQTECRMYVGNVTAEGVYSPVTVWAQACPRWPSLQPADYAGGSWLDTFDSAYDSYEPANTSEAACVKRAREYAAWCYGTERADLPSRYVSAVFQAEGNTDVKLRKGEAHASVSQFIQSTYSKPWQSPNVQMKLKETVEF